MGKKKNNSDKNIKGGFLDGIDLNDEHAIGDAIVDFATKQGHTVVQEGEPGSQISLDELDSMGKGAPVKVTAGGAGSDPAGARDILKKIGEAIVQTSKRTTEISNLQVNPPANKSNKKRKKGAVRFYWQYADLNGDGPDPAFMITPKEHFDEEGTLYDGDFDKNDLPPGFYELMESTFEFDGTRQQAEALLRANPIFEEKKMV